MVELFQQTKRLSARPEQQWVGTTLQKSMMQLVEDYQPLPKGQFSARFAHKEIQDAEVQDGVAIHVHSLRDRELHR